MQDSKSKRRQDGKSSQNKTFGQLLADERERLSEERSFEGKTIGYARNGQVYIGQTIQRVYN